MKRTILKIAIWLLSEIILNLLGMDDLADSVEWLEIKRDHFNNQEVVIETNERTIQKKSDGACFWGTRPGTARLQLP